MAGPFELPTRMVVEEAQDALPSHLQYPLLSPAECMQLRDRFNRSELLTPGLVGIGNGQYQQSDFRVCDATTISEQEFPQLFTQLKRVIREANQVFRFDLYGLFDDLLFVRYGVETSTRLSGRFGWHGDTGSGVASLRKLSLSVALSAPTEYTGGEFQLFHNGIVDLDKLPQGSVTIFPSFVQHRVAPLHTGERCMLVTFVIGPRFR